MVRRRRGQPVGGTARRGRAPARWAIAVALLLIILGSSCARSLRNPFSSMGPPAPEVLAAGAPLDQIMAAVNQNAQKVASYQTNNASISIPGALGIPTLRGNIAAQRPGRVRLQASTALTGPEVDMGSNDELFWFWVRRNEPPQLYFARHAQTPGSAAQQLMPIDPQWLLDALGMAEFRPTDVHEGPLPGRDKNTVEIKSVVNSAGGPMVKRTVVDARRAWVVEQHLYDGAGSLLASAVARSHRYLPESGVSLPQVIEIRIPPAELAMTIDVGTVELNRLVENPQLWALPTIPGSPAVDLGATPAAALGGVAPPLGRQIYDADWYDPAPPGGAPSMVATAPLAPPTPATALSVPAAPTAQFIPPGGVPAPAGDPFDAAAAASAQRIPPTGVAPPAFTR